MTVTVFERNKKCQLVTLYDQEGQKSNGMESIGSDIQVFLVEINSCEVLSVIQVNS